MAIEGHAHDHLVGRDTGVEVPLDGVVGTDAAGDVTFVQGGVVAGRTAHVIGHDIDPVDEGQHRCEIHVTGARRRGEGEQAVRADRRPQLLHEQGEVLRVVLRG